MLLINWTSECSPLYDYEHLPAITNVLRAAPQTKELIGTQTKSLSSATAEGERNWQRIHKYAPRLQNVISVSADTVVARWYQSPIVATVTLKQLNLNG